jgi:FtsP/CotA-like multicopper oxidase with cupredoxin domain
MSLGRRLMLASAVAVLLALFGGAVQSQAATPLATREAKATAALRARFSKITTNTQRRAAAERLVRLRQTAPRAGLRAVTPRAVLNPNATPDYFGTIPNYANSELPTGPIGSYIVADGGSGYSATPTVKISDISWGGGTGATATATVTGGVITGLTITNPGANYIAPTVTITDPTGSGAEVIAVLDSGKVSGGVPKFVDSLPGLGAANANDLGQYIPVAVPDTTTFPGSDYYEIGLVQYTEKMNRDLPPTTLRGYVQIETPANAGQSKHVALKYPNGSPILDATGAQVYAVDNPHYLGPTIVAQANRAVRVKFTNYLPTGSAGDLFLPVDTTVMGAGKGPLGAAAGNYTQNRAELHLHGGLTPWISDGTPHQWTVPAGETTAYKRGVSVAFVPDMWFSSTTHKVVPAGTPGATNDPGPGSLTYYYTNQQSARLMFYHDHAYGITRLNVYGGEAAPYVLQDPTEKTLINGGTINGTTVAAGTIPGPADTVPLVIQDRTFVPNTTQLTNEDPTWNVAKWGGLGQLWLPHVYMPNQSTTDVTAMGRWDYAFWFYPPTVGIVHGPVANPLAGQPGEPALNPGTPTPTIVPESFMDTPVVNGTAYPYLRVGQKAYRLRILNACDDRMLNLQLYIAGKEVSGAPVATTAAMWNANGTLNDASAGEVPMVPAAANTPGTVGYTPGETDGRDGGLPDARAAGPSMIQIGNEGGFLPNPVVLPNRPVGYEYFRRTITVLNVKEKTLFMGPAERADVIVDFSQLPDGTRVVLYNDAPAPNPGFDSRYDYYSGDPNQTGIGGAPDTTPGYGPDTRTIMEFVVDKSLGTAPAYNVNALNTALPAAYGASQPAPIVPESAYNAAFKANFPDTYMHVVDETLKFTPFGQSTPVTFTQHEKAIIEGFDFDYGRMNANLGSGLPNLGPTAGTAVPYAYAEAPTDNILNTPAATQIGALADGTQIWRVDHQGVDTHAIHFHLFNVQLINRVAIDGQLFPPDPNELGWKETVRMNPGQDVIIALRPMVPTLPWKLPDSVRPLEPTVPLNGTFMDANGLMVPNALQDFGWEYVWHCHLLGHEENDMMRPMVFQVAPPAPRDLAATWTSTRDVQLRWINNAALPAATMYRVQRATDAAFTSGVRYFIINGAIVTQYLDASANGTPYYYRVRAENAAAYSPWSNAVNPGGVPASPTSLRVTSVTLVNRGGGNITANMSVAWINHPLAGVAVSGIRVYYNLIGPTGPWTLWTTLAGTANTYTFRNLSVGATYWVRVEAFNSHGASSSGVISRRI